ncbi:MAG: hypothetical protein QOF48_2241 [Verrucomicrobiota bacterium]|jgi:hypothetical protein
MNKTLTPLQRGLALALAGFMAAPAMTPVLASSHMDAPLIVRDPSANTTDVYAFVQVENGVKTLVTALGVYPHQEPGIGPNKYNFDENVLYEIHVATGKDLAKGRATYSYQFQFRTEYRTTATILQSYLGVVQNIGDAAQNLVQTYTVTRVDHKRDKKKVLGTGIVPPNNQGIATPFYNQGDNGENPAKEGVSTDSALDRYTSQAVTNFSNGYIAFAGQRDDGFYADIQSVFDLLKLRSPSKDSQGGFNIHLVSLAIPVSELGGDQQMVGVYATTSRKQISVLREDDDKDRSDQWVQVARQGNPLFNEALVAIADKDRYSRSTPENDSKIFRKYAEKPELARLINLIIFGGAGPAIETNRTDLVGIFIPDLIKVDLSTTACRLAGGGPANPTNPDDAGYSRLGIFGGDVLQSAIQDPFGNGGMIPGGWPNGRRFGDDVVDIAVSAIISDLRGPLVIRVADGIDGVSANDIGYNKAFPYEATPQNGRNHHHP